MNPDALTDQFDLYLAVLETGSFSAAARRLQLTPSSVARRIDALEKAMGCVLVARNTHAVRATAAGLAFAERARRILAELRQARAEAVSLSSAPEGLIRIDAPAPFGRRHLAPAIADFLTLYPGLDVQLRLIDSFVDLHGDHLGEVDLVLRIGPLADTRLVATPLASMTRILCASPEYVRRRGLLRDPRELPQHDGLDWDALSPPHAWRFEVEGRLQLLRPGRLRMTANNAETLLFSALAGLGIAHLPTWLISDYLLRGELLPLLCEDGRPPPNPAASMPCVWPATPARAPACCWNSSSNASARYRPGTSPCSAASSAAEASAQKRQQLGATDHAGVFALQVRQRHRVHIIGAARGAAVVHFGEGEGRIRRHMSVEPQVASRARGSFDGVVGTHPHQHHRIDAAHAQPALQAGVNEGIRHVLFHHMLAIQRLQRAQELRPRLSRPER